MTILKTVFLSHFFFFLHFLCLICHRVHVSFSSSMCARHTCTHEYLCMASAFQMPVGAHGCQGHSLVGSWLSLFSSEIFTYNSWFCQLMPGFLVMLFPRGCGIGTKSGAVAEAAILIHIFLTVRQVLSLVVSSCCKRKWHVSLSG